MEVIGRAESGTETERMSGTHSRGRTNQDAYMEVSGTTAWTQEVESRREQRPRKRMEQVACRTQVRGVSTSAGMRAGRATQEQLPRSGSFFETESRSGSLPLCPAGATLKGVLKRTLEGKTKALRGRVSE